MNKKQSNKQKEFLTTSELADLLGISRVAVFKKIKKGEIKAEKIGRNYVIRRKDLGEILSKALNKAQKKKIDRAVEKVFKEYGETLKMLGKN